MAVVVTRPTWGFGVYGLKPVTKRLRLKRVVRPIQQDSTAITFCQQLILYADFHAD